MLENIIDQYPDEELLKVDGFDDAIISIDETSTYVGEKTPIWCIDNL